MYLNRKQPFFSQKKIALVSGLFCLSIFLSPIQVSAQTLSPEQEYQAQVQQLISQLLEQIAILQALLDEQRKMEVDRPGIISSNVVVQKRYQIDGEGSADRIQDSRHRQYLQRVFEIFPSEYDAKVSEFLVFSDPKNGFDAFVETLPPTHTQWAFAVNSQSLDEVDSPFTTELIVHELAHLVSYDEILGKPSSAIADCRDYFKTNGCPKDNSYIIAFADEFWTNAELRRAKSYAGKSNRLDLAYDYFDQNEDDFVSGYAAFSPEEDFAESFAHYVTDRPSQTDTLASKKIWWFDQFFALQKMRSQIRFR